jgi:phospholipid/cholesterol/gamma-HCH transport system substrate-binding protein
MTRLPAALLRLLSPRRLVLLVVAVLVVASLAGWTRDRSRTVIHAEFANTAGLYVGDDVRVLGVRVGEVTEVDPHGDRVVVELAVDGDQPVPADARAAIVSPSLVSGRFVQLEPVWTKGPRLADGDRIDVARTAVPASFDDVKQELTDLATALGPAEGTQGALHEAVTSIDANLARGNAKQLQEALTSLRTAASSLSSGRQDLFGTISNLNEFTENLATSDAAVRGFTTRLGDVSAVLRAHRTELTGAVAALGSALESVDALLERDGTTITTTVTRTNELAATLADRSNELAGVLHVAPHSLIGLHNTIEDQAITGRAALANLDSVAELLCGSILGVGGTSAQCKQALQPLLSLLALEGVPRLGATGSPTTPAAPGPTTSAPRGPGGLGSGLGELLEVLP